MTPEVHFQKDLGLDSLDNVEIVMALEEEFKLEIPDKEADKIDSCHLAIEYISNHPMASWFEQWGLTLWISFEKEIIICYPHLDRLFGCLYGFDPCNEDGK